MLLINFRGKYIDMDIVEIEDVKEGSTRKRRRSELEEAVITILDTGTTEKRKRANDEGTEDKSMDFQEPSSSKDIHIESQAVSEQSKATREINKTSRKELTIEDDEPSSSSTVKEKTDQSKGETPKPVKITIQTKLTRHVVKTPTQNSVKSSTTNDKLQNSEKSTTPQKHKSKRDKSLNERNKEDISKAERRRSKGNRSLSNNSSKSDETSSNKDKPKENSIKSKTVDTVKSANDKNTALNIHNNMNTLDDNISLAAIARESGTNIEPNNVSGLPTISSVVSLSTAHGPKAYTSTEPKTVEITIEADPDSSIFTPTSTDNIVNVKDAANKLQKLRKENEPMVGRVGVRAFARMKSPEKETNDHMQVEIKAEPIDLDEPERHTEKMDLMNAFKLRPVNPSTSLREVRINKVILYI